jgi:hypothetical protein
MKKNVVLIVMVSLFLLLLTTPGYSWQGRMAGMGDATGLIEDESDYLIHPAVIASGKGLNVYGNYRLTYDKATTWDYSMTSPGFDSVYPYNASGYEWKNEGQLGTAFTLGSGRMGVFFEYTGISGKYSGDEIYTHWNPTPGYLTYDLKNNLDNYALKIIYGLPAGNINLGGEIQIAYRNEEKYNHLSDINHAGENYPWAAYNNTMANLYPYMIPFNSQYWEAQGKVSIDGSMRAAKYAVTFKGGLPISSKNKYDYTGNFADSDTFGLEGNIKGWNLGGDFWLRVPLSSNIVLPFIVSTGYKQIQRDGSGLSTGNGLVNYEHEAKDFFIKVGGGVDYTPTQGFKMATGLYYDFLNTQQSIALSETYAADEYFYATYSDMPKQSEHRLTLKALAEKELSSTFALRGGFSVFYGRVKGDYAYSGYDNDGATGIYPLDVSTSGSNWGANLSIGATVKIDKISLEPFINGGYMKYRTSGDGTFDTDRVTTEFEKTNWIIGGGLSVKF